MIVMSNNTFDRLIDCLTPIDVKMARIRAKEKAKIKDIVSKIKRDSFEIILNDHDTEYETKMDVFVITVLNREKNLVCGFEMCALLRQSDSEIEKVLCWLIDRSIDQINKESVRVENE